MINIAKIRSQFPILKRQVNGKDLVYFDNGASTQKPLTVIDALNNYYKNKNANVHRGTYQIAESATKQYELARESIAQFINASAKEIIFTKSTTESINLIAYSL